MPEYKPATTKAQPVKREYVETVNKSTGASAAPAPKSPNEDRSVEVKPLPPMKPQASAKPKNFSSPPPTPKPRPEPEAKVTLGKPVFMQTDGSFVSAAKPQRSKIGQ